MLYLTTYLFIYLPIYLSVYSLTYSYLFTYLFTYTFQREIYRRNAIVTIKLFRCHGDDFCGLDFGFTREI